MFGEALDVRKSLADRLRRPDKSNADRLDGLFAGLFAATAMLGTDAAMLVLARVLFTFFGASSASRATSGKDLDNPRFIGAGPASPHGSCGLADVRAVQIQSDALTKLRDHLFGKTGIGARDAGLGAGETFLDAADQGIVGAALNIRMGGDHLSHVMHLVSPFFPGRASVAHMENGSFRSRVPDEFDTWIRASGIKAVPPLVAPLPKSLFIA